ncbi:MAG: DUF4962 domain-containing protein [Cyclobacteriaceae bacterium]
MNNTKLTLFLTLILWIHLIVNAQISFPKVQPENGNFNRPLAGQVLDVSPPGFCWWRAAPRGEVSYRLRIQKASGDLVYQSGLLADPVHVPDQVLPPGSYQWIVDALDQAGKVVTSRETQDFNISEDAFKLPWVQPKELLSRVPKEHPRLLFPKSRLNEIRASLNDARKQTFEDIRKTADEALRLELMEKPDFDKYDIETEYPARRTAYRASYHEFTSIYNRGMIPMALVYVLTGEEKYGLAAKKHLLNLLDWELDGVASLDESFDEIGLRIARTAAQAYDWLYDLMTDEEREAVKQMLIARGDQMLDRLERRDFLHKSAYSHDGRLPGYLLEFSIALAEEERAEVWMDYAMRALLTVFPHWGGKDGGWAEGVNYALSYNERFITPLQSLYEATGYNLWEKSYFRNMRHFLVYCVSPVGEIMPFGDNEHHPISYRGGDLHAILKFHSLLHNDADTRWWIEQLDTDRTTDRFNAMHEIILEDKLDANEPSSMKPDRAFHGIGWAALHSDILSPENDLMVLFKSSPYGSVSHSHADQNSFAIMKGGKALANTSGARYPQHQSPFHFQYSNLTVAHNALLINGEGQIDRSALANGRIADFKSTAHMGYVAGAAENCYGDRLDYYQRHVIMIRPSIILVVDDLSGSQPIEVDWLLHSREEILLDPENQSIESFRKGASMKTQLITQGEFDFSVTNEWPIDPKKDYPMVTAEPPAKEWHFTGSPNQKTNKRRIAAIMTIKEDGDYPTCKWEMVDGKIKLAGNFGKDKWSGVINMDTNSKKGDYLLDLFYEPASGPKETIRVVR